MRWWMGMWLAVAAVAGAPARRSPPEVRADPRCGPSGVQRSVIHANLRRVGHRRPGLFPMFVRLCVLYGMRDALWCLFSMEAGERELSVCSLA